MLEEIKKCPICENKEFTSFLTCTDHTVSKKQFHLVKCTHCNFLFTNPRPDLNSIGKYYDSDEYISHKDKGNSIINILYKTIRNYTLQKKVQLINKLSVKGNILDYGCGTGYFLKACKENGWNIEGIEPDKGANQQATQNLDKTIHDEINQIKNIKFNIITLWHVLEHIHDLNDTLSKITSLLREDGKLLIAVPNYQSYDAEKYQSNWAAYDVPRHLYHFDKKTIQLLAEKYNFKVEHILPMKFDSFYVSMLSEKYLGNQYNLLKPFITGCKSNIYAKKSKNYSSLIYILSK